MHGGLKFYRGSARAARAYVEADHSRADDYYLAEGSGIATRYVAGPDGVRTAGELSGDDYERWVAGYAVDTGQAKGRLRDDANALRFVEVTVNGPKTWSLAAALHPEISAALDAAQDRAAEQIIGWLAHHATTRIGPRGRQVQVPVEQIEAAVIRHYTSRAGDPHRHLHLQVNARVFADGKWRGLHSVGVRDMIEAINGIGHAAVATDPEFRAVLAAHGFTMDTIGSGGELVELGPYVGKFSARANQIHRNVDRYEVEWRRDHPDEEPGPRLREAWDRHAWADARPDKPNTPAPVDGAALVAAWNRLLHELGYRGPAQVGLPIVPTAPSVGSLDRDGIAETVVAELGAEHSAWNPADIRGRVEQHLAAAGLITDAAVRLDLAEDITARAITRCVPLIEDPGVPEHVRSLTSQHVLDVEAELVAAMAQRAEHPGRPVDTDAMSSSLDDAQREAVAVLAGTGQLVMVEGAAGAGKTTALAAVRDQLAEQGRRMVVVTPTLKAAQVATKETGVAATSAAGLAREFGWEWDDAGHWRQQQPQNVTADGAAHQVTALARGDLLLVDEVGMLDQDTALALFQIAEQTGARVALVGDRHQLPAVGRGGVLDLAARWAHPNSVVGLDVVHRFADAAYATISLAMRGGEHAPEIFDQLWDRGQIRLHATETERLHAIATDAAAQIAADQAGMVVMADTLAQVSVLNGIIRDQLVAHGLVDDVRVVTTNAGERIGVGDRVATRLNDHHLGVANRDQWTVTAVGDDGSFTLTPAAHNRLVDRIAGGAPVRDVPGWYVATRVELAYATTVYGAQGETTGTGHMLLSDTTTGSAAYVGMTRGRHDNVAHLVAGDVHEARAIWAGVMGRDRADLGPAHAAEQAAEEMELYAPQRPARVVLDQLHQAWSRQADLTGQARNLIRHRDDIEAVMSIRAEHEPRARQLHEAARAAWDRESAAAGALKALEAKIAVEQRDLTSELLDCWHREHVGAYQAAAILRAGPGRLGQHRRQVRDARADLTAWARRWQPLLPDLPTDPEQVRRHLETPPPQTRGDQLRLQITDTAQQSVARAHPEAEPIRIEAAAAQQAARHAADAVIADATALGEQLRPYRWAHARADKLPRALAEVRRELETVDARLQQANERIDHLLHSPEIRSLPPSTMQTEHDQWRADRAAAKEAADIAAAAARAVRTRQPKPGLEPPAYHRSGPTSPGLSL